MRTSFTSLALVLALGLSVFTDSPVFGANTHWQNISARTSYLTDLILQDDYSQFEVKTADGEWIRVPLEFHVLGYSKEVERTEGAYHYVLRKTAWNKLELYVCIQYGKDEQDEHLRYTFVLQR